MLMIVREKDSDIFTRVHNVCTDVETYTFSYLPHFAQSPRLFFVLPLNIMHIKLWMKIQRSINIFFNDNGVLSVI